jgi:hypothetical protein
MYSTCYIKSDFCKISQTKEGSRKIFFRNTNSHSDQFLGRPGLPMGTGEGGTFLEDKMGKRPVREGNHQLPTCEEVKNKGSYNYPTRRAQQKTSMSLQLKHVVHFDKNRKLPACVVSKHYSLTYKHLILIHCAHIESLTVPLLRRGF